MPPADRLETAEAVATDPAPAGGEPTRVPDGVAPDGLRALAVAGVMAFHFGLGLAGGFLGVDLFFVISGYVITRLLLIEWERTGTIGWARFWGRRARRLLPVVMLVLIAVQAWLRLDPPFELLSTTNAQTVAALAYVSNWYAIVANVGYWGAGADATPLTHLWSLAVEEQFYLAWPLLLVTVLMMTRFRRVLAATAATGVVASYLASGMLFRAEGPDRAYMGTDTRAGALLIGVLCALVLTRRSPASDGSWDRRAGGRCLAATRLAVPAAVAALGVLWATAGLHVAWLYPGGLTVAGAAAAVVVAYPVAAPESALARSLGSRPMVGVGRLSYSLYLWHWPVHIFALHRWAELARPLLILTQAAVTFALAALSFTLVERPARRIHRVAPLTVSLAACALLILVSALCFQPRPSVERQTGVIVHGPAH